jgi:hypothetical protein
MSEGTYRQQAGAPRVTPKKLPVPKPFSMGPTDHIRRPRDLTVPMAGYPLRPTW